MIWASISERRLWMARAKVILVDADVIAHFIATGHIMELNGILSPHQLYVVENVYREATRHPGDANRKQKVDEWIKDSKTCVIKFPSQNQNIKREFFKLKHDNGLLGDGECACMAMARYGQETIASSNFRDVAPYCDANDIEYIGVMDILQIAINKGYWTDEQCDQFIMDAIKENNARFPVDRMEVYKTEKDLGGF